MVRSTVTSTATSERRCSTSPSNRRSPRTNRSFSLTSKTRCFAEARASRLRREAEYDDRIEELLEESTHIKGEEVDNIIEQLKVRFHLGFRRSRETYENIRYRLNRDIVGLGPLEPVMRDPANEDIHVIGPSECYVDHGVYGMVETTVDFGTRRSSTAGCRTWVSASGIR